MKRVKSPIFPNPGLLSWGCATLTSAGLIVSVLPAGEAPGGDRVQQRSGRAAAATQPLSNTPPGSRGGAGPAATYVGSSLPIVSV